jgi:hypothetical protein
MEHVHEERTSLYQGWTYGNVHLTVEYCLLAEHVMTNDVLIKCSKREEGLHRTLYEC